MRGVIARVPIAGAWLRDTWQNARRRLGRRAAVRALARTPHPAAGRIAAALGSLAREGNDETLLAIEKERAALSVDATPLAAVHGGESGLYDEGVSVSQACAASKPPEAARFLHALVRAFAPRRVLELGTNVGVSSAYQAAALAANGGGRVVTLESSPHRQRIARDLHARVGLRNVEYRLGLFEDTLEAAASEWAPIDFAFIDGHHQHAPTLAYFETVWRHAGEEAVFVFDDIHWSTGMERAWTEITADARVAFAVDLFDLGVCVVRREPVPGERTVAGPFRYAL